MGSNTHQRAQSIVRPAARAASLPQPNCNISRLSASPARGANQRERDFNVGVINLPAAAAAALYRCLLRQNLSLVHIIQTEVASFVGSDNILCPLLICVIDGD